MRLESDNMNIPIWEKAMLTKQAGGVAYCILSMPSQTSWCNDVNYRSYLLPADKAAVLVLISDRLDSHTVQNHFVYNPCHINILVKTNQSGQSGWCKTYR